MKLKDIISISGEGGLFRFIAQGKNSIIVEHLETKKRSAAHGTAKVSSLEDIAIFTETEEIPLGEIFDKMWDKENGGSTIDHKSKPEELKKYFKEIQPDYDEDRVYTSDLKKLFNWYNILHNLNLLEKEDEEEKEDGEDSSDNLKDKKTELAKKTAETKKVQKSVKTKAEKAVKAKKVVQVKKTGDKV